MRFVFAHPRRSFRKALKYWWPRRLTLKYHSRVDAWLWWNISYSDFDPEV